MILEQGPDYSRPSIIGHALVEFQKHELRQIARELQMYTNVERDHYDDLERIADLLVDLDMEEDAYRWWQLQQCEDSEAATKLFLQEIVDVFTSVDPDAEMRDWIWWKSREEHREIYFDDDYDGDEESHEDKVEDTDIKFGKIYAAVQFDNDMLQYSFYFKKNGEGIRWKPRPILAPGVSRDMQVDGYDIWYSGKLKSPLFTERSGLIKYAVSANLEDFEKSWNVNFKDKLGHVHNVTRMPSPMAVWKRTDVQGPHFRLTPSKDKEGVANYWEEKRLSKVMELEERFTYFVAPIYYKSDPRNEGFDLMQLDCGNWITLDSRRKNDLFDGVAIDMSEWLNTDMAHTIYDSVKGMMDGRIARHLEQHFRDKLKAEIASRNVGNEAIPTL